MDLNDGQTISNQRQFKLPPSSKEDNEAMEDLTSRLPTIRQIRDNIVLAEEHYAKKLKELEEKANRELEEKEKFKNSVAAYKLTLKEAEDRLKLKQDELTELEGGIDVQLEKRKEAFLARVLDRDSSRVSQNNVLDAKDIDIVESPLEKPTLKRQSGYIKKVDPKPVLKPPMKPAATMRMTVVNKVSKSKPEAH